MIKNKFLRMANWLAFTLTTLNLLILLSLRNTTLLWNELSNNNDFCRTHQCALFNILTSDILFAFMATLLLSLFIKEWLLHPVKSCLIINASAFITSSALLFIFFFTFYQPLFY